MKLARFILCAENLFICAKQCCWNLKYYLLCGCLSILRDGKSSASAPVPLVLGCSGINLSALFPMFGSFEGGAQHNEQGNRTIMREHSHLAIEFYNLNFGEALGIRKTEFGALSMPWPDGADSSL